MRLVLTSGGISNKSIEKELRNIIGKDFKDLKMLFCITASNYEGGDMNNWLIDDLLYLKNLGFKIDVCDINGISKENFIPRFEWADVFYFEGGNTQWLRRSIKESGLEEKLKELHNISTTTNVEHTFKFSIDGITKQTYETSRPGGDFKIVLKNFINTVRYYFY